MSSHQQRVVDEKRELDARIEALHSFIGNLVFVSLTKDERERLTRQRTIMRQYSHVLSERIAAFQV